MEAAAAHPAKRHGAGVGGDHDAERAVGGVARRGEQPFGHLALHQEGGARHTLVVRQEVADQRGGDVVGQVASRQGRRGQTSPGEVHGVPDHDRRPAAWNRGPAVAVDSCLDRRTHRHAVSSPDRS